jgi:hypothetical protein
MHAYSAKCQRTLHRIGPAKCPALLTPRSALRAALRSSHMFRLWRRDRWADGSQWACQWVRQTDVLDFIECTEELEEVAAMVDVLTSFVLCDTIVPTERDWAAVESQME